MIKSVVLFVVVQLFVVFSAYAQDATSINYRLAPSDVIRVSVFKHEDLTLDTRVAEDGMITYPLIGEVEVGGSTLAQAERSIATRLNKGGFVKDPQVNISVLQLKGNQVSVLGFVNRPGRYPLDTATAKLSDVVALAGGISISGSDTVIISGIRNGQPFSQRVDFPTIFTMNKSEKHMTVQGGDVVYVGQAPTYYIYGEVNRPGSYRVQRQMTVQQALAQGGGITVRGTDSNIKLHRKQDNGFTEISPELYDLVLPDDVIYIRESIF
ncbi:MAG: polysaccharide export protein EpsE [Pseudomonadales bacterium]|nr:polysaccharide export protein EpsE [Pseudomonadales bacterium]